MDKDLEIFQGNLGYLLPALGWTQKFLAEQLDVSRQQVANMVSGRSFNRRHYLAIQYVIGQAYKEHTLSEDQFMVFKKALTCRIHAGIVFE